jgi:hypothetical protein
LASVLPSVFPSAIASLHLQGRNPHIHGRKNGSICVFAPKTDTVETALRVPSPLAFFGSVVPSVIAPPPNIFLCFFSRDHARDYARKAKASVGRWRDHGRDNGPEKREWRRPLKGRLHSRFCVRFSIRDGATAQLIPLLFSRDHVRDRSKEAVRRRRHRGRRNGRKKRDYRRPLSCLLNAVFHVLRGPVPQDAGTPLLSLLQIQRATEKSNLFHTNRRSGRDWGSNHSGSKVRIKGGPPPFQPKKCYPPYPFKNSLTK